LWQITTGRSLRNTAPIRAFMDVVDTGLSKRISAQRPAC
jgi:hypothetical protein